jgi:xanthosine utilization system XapX-like protein
MEIALFVVALVGGTICVLLVGWKLKALVTAVSKQEAAGSFYFRALIITMLFGVLASVANEGVSVTANDEVMEYVWGFADALEGAFWVISLQLLGYVLLMTILLAALGRRNVE